MNDEFLCKKCEIMLKREAKFSVEKIEKKEFVKLIYIFKYDGIIRKEILKYKFKDEPHLYKTFANFLLKNKKIFQNLKSYDTIIPIPISRKRKKARGYNQSYLISKEIAKNVGLKLENKCLIKTKNVIEQSKLNKEQRAKNIQGAYKLENGNRLKNKKIILFDDIYTTGSTVNECCKILKQAIPNKIVVLALAKD